MQLSSLADYMLYQPNGLKTTLETEIEQLKNYIEFLQQEHNNKISLFVSPDVIHSQYAIKPMQLISFAVSTFTKTAVVPDIVEIKISLNEKKNMLQFIIIEIPHNSNGNFVNNYTQLNVAGVKRKLVINCFQK